MSWFSATRSSKINPANATTTSTAVDVARMITFQPVKEKQVIERLVCVISYTPGEAWITTRNINFERQLNSELSRSLVNNPRRQCLAMRSVETAGYSEGR